MSEYVNNKIHDLKLCFRILFRGEVDKITQTILTEMLEVEDSLKYFFDDDVTEDLKVQIIKGSLESVEMANVEISHLTGYPIDKWKAVAKKPSMFEQITQEG